MFYVFILLALLGAGIGLFPVPEEIIVLSAGVGIQQKLGSSFVIFAVVFIGVIMGDIILFHLGRKYGEKMFNIKIFSFFLPKKNVEKVQKVFNGHAGKLIFIARFVSGLRAIVFFVSGMSKIRLGIFVFVDTIANLIYIPFFLFLGYRFSYDISRLIHGFTQIYHVIEIAILWGIVCWVTIRLSKKSFSN